MIEISQLVALLRAKSVETRIQESQEAWEWARGVYVPPAGVLTPRLTGPEHTEDYARISRLVKSVGERALNIKTTAAVGNVTWGDDTPSGNEDAEAFKRRKAELDDTLRPLRLEENARKLAEQWNVDGVMAVHAYLDRETNRPKLSRLTGYLEPYLHPRNMDEVQGLYQAKSRLTSQGHTRWWVRVYDWSDSGETCVIREWRDLMNPTALATTPDDEFTGAQIPAVRIGPTTQDGLVMSRFLASLPLMRAVMAVELSLERARELAAWPIPVFKNATEVTVVSPAVPVQVSEDGDFFFAEPGNLDALQQRLDDRLRRFTQDMCLPSAIVGANRSGESLREESLAFYNDARSDAAVLSELLTEGLERYATIADGVKAVPVGVSPNMEYIREQMLAGVALMLDKGLLPRPVAMREIQPFFPTFSDDELQRAIKEAKAFVTPEDALRALGDAGEGEEDAST